MEKVENIAKYILFLDKNDKIFVNKLVNLNGRDCYEGNDRLNKYFRLFFKVKYIKNKSEGSKLEHHWDNSNIHGLIAQMVRAHAW